MARESCNLDKDEAEILKPSSSPSSPPPRPPSPPTSASSPPALFLKPPQDHLPPENHPDVANPHTQNPEHQSQQQPEPPPPTADSGSSSCTRKRKEAKEDGHQPPTRFTNRCSSCQRKVGLTGFRCRCGDLFCPRHRHSDAHDCPYDYKAAGREEIAKANPVIKAAKIIKI